MNVHASVTKNNLEWYPIHSECMFTRYLSSTIFKMNNVFFIHTDEMDQQQQFDSPFIIAAKIVILHM